MKVSNQGSSHTLRVCIVAEHASYRFGGEAVLPLHYFSGLLAANSEVWLVVHSRTRAELEELFPQALDRLRFVSDTVLHRLIFRLSKYLPRRVAEATLGLLNQLLTQFVQRKIVRRLVAEESIDVIHQPIPVSPRFPSLITGMGAPVVIGPMNGGMDYPAAFRRTESAFTRISIHYGRSFANFVNFWLAGKRKAAILLVANQRTRLALPSCAHGEVIEFPENGIDLRTWAAPAGSADNPSPSSRRFVFIGRLVDWKGVDMAIEAISRVPSAELEIIGNGPMQAKWKQTAEALGVSDRVFFTGWLAQKEISARLRSAVALILPSIYECGGAVVLEAMATGLPVIATRWGGPADYLDETCGILVEPSSREALVDGFAAAMQKLIATPELRATLGGVGRMRAEHQFNWKNKIDRILEIYEQAICQSSLKNVDHSLARVSAE
jgi:glycosyltransferase involved in cell wall biosynthesis